MRLDSLETLVCEHLFQKASDKQLNAGDEGAEKAEHAEKLESVVGLHQILLADIADAVESRTAKTERVAQEAVRTENERQAAVFITTTHS